VNWYTVSLCGQIRRHSEAFRSCGLCERRWLHLFFWSTPDFLRFQGYVPEDLRGKPALVDHVCRSRGNVCPKMGRCGRLM
jgi:hypothetical protein